MYQKVSPMFLVDDVDKAVEFYKQAFEAKLSASLPKTPPLEWASLHLNGNEFILWQKRRHKRSIPIPPCQKNPAVSSSIYMLIPYMSGLKIK